jgi:WhiB family redox-sensing transcriptional regulator
MREQAGILRSVSSPFTSEVSAVIGVNDGDVRSLLAILSGADSITGDLRWMDRALCAQVDGDLFFVERGCSPRPAKRICAACEVREPCLEYALANNEMHGVWGGTSELDRRRMRKRAAA